jgi:hypothetical protein
MASMQVCALYVAESTGEKCIKNIFRRNIGTTAYAHLHVLFFRNNPFWKYPCNFHFRHFFFHKHENPPGNRFMQNT